jgi:DNA-binding GntR family transcriptional regulator
VAEHRDMIAALAARDGAALRDLLVRHLQAKKQAVLETMKNEVIQGVNES